MAISAMGHLFQPIRRDVALEVGNALLNHGAPAGVHAPKSIALAHADDDQMTRRKRTVKTLQQNISRLRVTPAGHPLQIWRGLEVLLELVVSDVLSVIGEIEVALHQP